MEIHGTKPVNPHLVGSDVANVATPNTAYKEMEKKWELVEALRGGTETMREKGHEYLPQEPRESEDAYTVRLNRTELYNLYNRTLTALTGIAFTKPVNVSNVPPELEYLQTDADGTGRSLNEIAYEMAIDCLHYGKTHLLTDFPETTGAKNLSEFRRAGYRPYFNQINPTRMIGWEIERGVGKPVLSNVRIIEPKVVPRRDNKWNEKLVWYVRVIRPNLTEVHVYDPEDDEPSFRLEKEVKNTLGYIPITTSYSVKTGFFQSAPALYDLARMNLLHWQSSSDQRNILHVARVPFIFASGFDEGELDDAEIGASRMIVSTRADATMKFVEHTGQAIEAGHKDLKEIENHMATLGADLLLSKGASRVTATARRIDQNESMSILQMALRGIENMIEKSYIIAGEWLGVDASEVTVSIGDDMSVANEPNPTSALIALKDSGLLTDEQLIQEAKRTGVLSSYMKLDPNRPAAKKQQAEEQEVEEQEDDPSTESTEIDDDEQAVE